MSAPHHPASARWADLHVHTCLSPCADLQMSPRNIARRARERGLDIIAICDHNSADNVAAVRRAAERVGLEVFGGMEITTREEVHLLALFGGDQHDQLLRLQGIVYEQLEGAGRWRHVREQVLASEDDEVLGFNPRPLVSATRLSLEQTVEIVHVLGGLAIASHIDREAFGLLGHLGFVPPGLALDAVEISSQPSGDQARQISSLPYPFIASSDAHFLEEIGRAGVTFGAVSGDPFSDLRRSLDSRSVRCERSVEPRLEAPSRPLTPRPSG